MSMPSDYWYCLWSYLKFHIPVMLSNWDLDLKHSLIVWCELCGGIENEECTRKYYGETGNNLDGWINKEIRKKQTTKGDCWLFSVMGLGFCNLFIFNKITPNWKVNPSCLKLVCCISLKMTWYLLCFLLRRLSSATLCGHLLEIHLLKVHLQALQSSGSTGSSTSSSGEHYSKPCESWSTSDIQPLVFLMTIRVGGVGLNLTQASRVIIADPSDNPRCVKYWSP